MTAAGQGIGRAIAERLHAEGAEVWASDIDTGKLAGLDVHNKAGLDVLDSQAVKDYAAQVGSIDCLLNVAGYVHHGSVLECSEEDWNTSFDLNVSSMHRMIRAFLPGMLERGAQTGASVSITNMSSGASSLKGAPNRYVYGATKAAVIGLTKSIAVDFATQRVRCNAICPGTVNSPSLKARMEAMAKESGGFEEAYARFVARQPLGRIAEPEEVAALAAFLSSDEAAFVTGSEYKVDGGWTL